MPKILNKITNSIDTDLIERARELNCLYQVEELFNKDNISLEEIMNKLLAIIPSGFRNSNKIAVKISFLNKIYQGTNFKLSKVSISADVKSFDDNFGKIEVYYLKNDSRTSTFFPEEIKLINTIADRLGHYAIYMKMRGLFQELQVMNKELGQTQKPEWLVILELLKKTDQNLYSILSRKMLNHLFCRGIKESTELFRRLGSDVDYELSVSSEINSPSKKAVLQQSFKLGLEIFELSANYFNAEEIMQKIQKWIHEEKSHTLIKLLANQNSPLTELADALRRYHSLNPITEEMTASPTRHGIVVALIRRILTDQLEFIDIAKIFFNEDDFFQLIQRLIFPSESYGKIGGKGSGLLLARKIIEKSNHFSEEFTDIKFPKTWYISSDGIMNFMYYNNMEDVLDQKYRDIDEIRQEYPHIIQAFKNSNFSPEILNGLSRALDDFGDQPIIVRSSSLLEDRLGTSFAGKYKSLFLANQGPKQQRLEELLDAVSEVYASVFGPDPIGYRTEKGLLDYNEEMAIMIQEVVGTKCGKYFFPAFSGVAFSHNEFRWSPRIDREDGLIRLVTGLGTRAVDRIGDDFPVLIAPGKPELRVNQTFKEVVGYSPKNIDVINLESNTFDTIPISEAIKEAGNNFPMLNEIFSIVDGTNIKKPVGLGIDVTKHDIVATFDNLITRTDYINKLNSVLVVLRDKLNSPVDLEFSCDGKNLYLLQCRPQASSGELVSAVIPSDVASDKIVFTANRYVSNGKVSDINYIVYVDPDEYAKIQERETLVDVGLAVGKLNQLLPKRNFILMGPGRWGSRDDIRLGVKVTYSDLHNCAVLIEIARQKGNYVPDLSFGTHFFQDLVEAGIRYLPLYPDSDGQVLNFDFLQNSLNSLTRLLPEFSHLTNVLRVINIPDNTNGQILRVLFNADLNKAMALITSPQSESSFAIQKPEIQKIDGQNEALQWRLRMAESLALKVDPNRFGIKGIYLIGTVFSGTASDSSDIDLLVHFEGTAEQKRDFKIWLEGWNNSLSQLNYYRSGYYISKMLDVKFISSSESNERKYHYDMMDPANNTSRKLSLGTSKIDTSNV